MISILELPEKYIALWGLDKAAEIAGVSHQAMMAWKYKGVFPMHAVDKWLKADPSPLGLEQPAVQVVAAPAPEVQVSTGLATLEPPKFDAKLAILMPCNSAPEPETLESLFRLYNPAEMEFHRYGFNNISVARNALAAQWLATSCPWAFWADADMVFPCKDAAFFRRSGGVPGTASAFTELHTIYRLLVHQKPFVSVCYFGRRSGSGAQFAGGSTPALRMDLRRGPRDEVREVEWCGFGGVLMHRKVLEAIIEQEGPEISVAGTFMQQNFGYTYSFFSPTRMDTPGDDIPFCERAGRAGFKPSVDLALFAGHVGSKTYNFPDL